MKTDAEGALRHAYLRAHGLHVYLRMRGDYGYAIHDTRTGETLDGGPDEDAALDAAEARMAKRSEEK